MQERRYSAPAKQAGSAVKTDRRRAEKKPDDQRAATPAFPAIAGTPRGIAGTPRGRWGAHRIVGNTTLCGIDARTWTTVEQAEAVSCPWCSIREKHEVSEPAPWEKLPEACRKELTAKQKQLAKKAAASAAKAGRS
jgi:hypothetical protein